MTPSKDSNVVLSKNSLLPVGSAIAIIVMVFAAMGYLEEKFEKVLSPINIIKDQQKDLEVLVMLLEDKMHKAWTMQDMRVWALEFEKHNPGVTVPDPMKIFTFK